MKNKYLFLFLPLLLTGCLTAEQGNIEEWAENVRASAKKGIPGIRKPSTIRSVEFEMRADPFNSVSNPTARGVMDTIGHSVPDISIHEFRRKDPLEAFSLDQLMLIGILIQEDGEREGLVRDMFGFIHIVKKGSYLGLNNGRVEDIEEERLVIEENYDPKIKGSVVFMDLIEARDQLR